MQKVKLPKQLDPVKSAMKRSDYVGVISSSDMPRLAEAAANVADWVEVEVKFEIDSQGLTYFSGHLATEVQLICQRCNELYAQPIHVSFCFSPVQGMAEDEVSELPEVYEPVEVNDHGEINLVELFEDELILSLPIVALHAEEDCNVRQDEMSYGEIEPANERPNPFAVLKELKRD
ncbi:23S rRNA accumulation protein YceD [Aestuariibacter sp. AA17]|uniref:Large ribosomal RNA subunit accumulation protein YceD n=1 Tax=Fluctibacter corallii TaxID=2984329 RepID=A0ABT3A7I7_9ALTE|nr:23S rRNA accumulation protein YceD [Aestuariibacter sp. AA17]MCV2884281.1 23S rRNA accumulation protein YceD [Aestuariibacter sp. AA17]